MAHCLAGFQIFRKLERSLNVLLRRIDPQFVLKFHTGLYRQLLRLLELLDKLLFFLG